MGDEPEFSWYMVCESDCCGAFFCDECGYDRE